MRVKWLEMTSDEVAEMSKRTRVALLPVGSVERHGPHLPCGTDFFTAEKISEMAAQIEPAIVLPGVCFNMASGMMRWHGTIATRPETTLALYRDLCAEAARNGFDRILMTVAHGGSQIIPQYYMEDLNWHRAHGEGPAYWPLWVSILAGARETIAQVIETGGGHACELETSLVMYSHPELVDTDAIPEGEAPLREFEQSGASTGVEWAMVHMEAYAGQPCRATAEKGRIVMEEGAKALAEIIRRVKTYDPVMPQSQWPHEP